LCLFFFFLISVIVLAPCLASYAMFICNEADKVPGSYSKLSESNYKDPSGAGDAVFTGDQKFGPLVELLAFSV
jgi:hypothetical protein